MQTAELERSKRLLQTLLRQLELPQHKRDDIAVENAPDSIDRVQRATERELTIRQIESDFTRLQNIRLALQRIDEGSYGTCLRCDTAISSKRLNILPWAAHCVKCQDIADRESKSQTDGEVMRAF
jgi:DnaK suppressor protein